MKDNKFLNEMQILEQNQKEINIKITKNNINNTLKNIIY